MSASQIKRSLIATLAAFTVAVGGTVAATPTAQAAKLITGCNETWTTAYSKPTGSSLYDLVIYYRSINKGKGIRFCVEMIARKNAPGRKMTINVTSPTRVSKSTTGGRLYVKQNVSKGNTLAGKTTFSYKNPAYPGGKRSVTTNFKINVT